MDHWNIRKNAEEDLVNMVNHFFDRASQAIHWRITFLTNSARTVEPDIKKKRTATLTSECVYVSHCLKCML
jgi:hypothetical protein